MSENEMGRGEPLDPARDPARWESAVRGILAAAAPELERRGRASSPVVVLAHWRRPVLSAAASVALLASAAILAGGRGGEESSSGLPAAEEAATVAGALVPGAVAAWLMDGDAESVHALVLSLEEGR